MCASLANDWFNGHWSIYCTTYAVREGGEDSYGPPPLTHSADFAVTSSGFMQGGWSMKVLQVTPVPM